MLHSAAHLSHPHVLHAHPNWVSAGIIWWHDTPGCVHELTLAVLPPAFRPRHSFTRFRATGCRRGGDQHPSLLSYTNILLLRLPPRSTQAYTARGRCVLNGAPPSNHPQADGRGGTQMVLRVGSDKMTNATIQPGQRVGTSK